MREGTPQREGGRKDERRGVALDVTQVTFFPGIQLPELECGQDSSGKSTTELKGNTLPNAGGNIPQAVTDERMGSNR